MSSLGSHLGETLLIFINRLLSLNQRQCAQDVLFCG